jgi:hypothetical protein
LNGASVSQDAHRTMRSRAFEFDIDHCVVQPKLTQYNSVEGRRELWIGEADRSCGRIEFNPKREESANVRAFRAWLKEEAAALDWSKCATYWRPAADRSRRA